MHSVIYHACNEIKICIVHKSSSFKIENCDVLTEIEDCKILELDYTLLVSKQATFLSDIFFCKRTIKECSSIWKYSQIPINTTAILLLLIQVLTGLTGWAQFYIGSDDPDSCLLAFRKSTLPIDPSSQPAHTPFKVNSTM